MGILVFGLNFPTGARDVPFNGNSP